MNYDQYLERIAGEYNSECKPEIDRQGDAHNCMECNKTQCEYYSKYNQE